MNNNLHLLPAPPELPVRLRELALVLMDAADLCDEGQAEEGRRLAREVAEQVRVLVTAPQA